jgi:hypothetical protein
MLLINGVYVLVVKQEIFINHVFNKVLQWVA